MQPWHGGWLVSGLVGWRLGYAWLLAWSVVFPTYGEVAPPLPKSKDLKAEPTGSLPGASGSR